MMTDTEKLNSIKASLEITDTASDALLMNMVHDAAAVVLNQMYPFGYSETTPVPARYERIQLRIAIELFSRVGAEGETQHEENGIARSYDTGFISQTLLRQIMPCAVPISEVNSDETSSA